eukprot:scaffold2512_cov164-Amphora_coffeaeformis.AAC.7
MPDDDRKVVGGVIVCFGIMSSDRETGNLLPTPQRSPRESAPRGETKIAKRDEKLISLHPCCHNNILRADRMISQDGDCQIFIVIHYASPFQTTRSRSRTSWRVFSMPPPPPPPPRPDDHHDVPTGDDETGNGIMNRFSTSRRHWASNLVLGSSAILTVATTPTTRGSAAAVTSPPPTTTTATFDTASRVREINDPQTYQALIYEPPTSSNARNPLVKPPPLLLVLHGAATNLEPDVYKAMASVTGEHAGLPMQLLASNTAPMELATNFCVAAPYAYGQRSFYDDSRGKLLQFVQYLASNALNFDPSRIFLFGFSDGATVAVELATSRKFRGVVVASYGFTGKQLPAMALQRLQGVGFWVWHAADDVIFDVANSDRLVVALRETNEITMDDGDDDLLVRYTRFETDPLSGKMGVRVDPSMHGHTMGIVAAQSPDLYKWMLSL